MCGSTIAAVNDAPTTSAADEDTTGTEDQAVSGTLAAGSDIEGDSLPFAEGSTAAVGGTVAIDAATGAYTFTRAANFNGTASFSYVVNDGTSPAPRRRPTSPLRRSTTPRHSAAMSTVR